MVQSKEILSLKKQVRRLKAKLAAIKSDVTDDDSSELVRLHHLVSSLRAENKALKKKTKRLEKRLANVDLAVVQRKRLMEKTKRLEERLTNVDLAVVQRK